METSPTPALSHIIITGPTGAGKTASGVALARLLGWTFIDLDESITTSEGASAAAIFASLGEEGWRERETAALARALSTERAVIATGAGIVERPKNQALAGAASAWIIALEVDPRTAFARIQADASERGRSIADIRPMLAGAYPLARLQALHDRRAPLYALADDTISTDDVMPEQVAARALAGFIVAGGMGEAYGETWVHHVVAGAGYEAVTGWGALAGLGGRLTNLHIPARLSLVTDDVVGPLYAQPLVRRLREAGYEPEALILPSGEVSKSRQTLATIHDWLAERRVERGEAVLALGGGVIGDMAGFAAATWLRGVPLIQIPTSLLAQVDASIGGKVAINHALGKNLIGAFYQPRLVLADSATLLTLPSRQRIEGWAEVVKHGVALDAVYFASIERDVDALLAVDHAQTSAAIARSVAIKGAIVGADEREREGGSRALLNFGHTMGHAIEATTGYQAWLHGEAVSVGMVFAARLGLRLGITPPGVVTRLETLLARFDLPTRLDGLDAGALLHAALWDKKARGGQVRWVLLTELGAARLADPAPEHDVRATLIELGAG